jgi:hypothetical protein
MIIYIFNIHIFFLTFFFSEFILGWNYGRRFSASKYPSENSDGVRLLVCAAIPLVKREKRVLVGVRQF